MPRADTSAPKSESAAGALESTRIYPSPPPPRLCRLSSYLLRDGSGLLTFEMPISPTVARPAACQLCLGPQCSSHDPGVPGPPPCPASWGSAPGPAPGGSTSDEDRENLCVLSQSSFFPKYSSTCGDYSLRGSSYHCGGPTSLPPPPRSEPRMFKEEIQTSKGRRCPRKVIYSECIFAQSLAKPFSWESL